MSTPGIPDAAGRGGWSRVRAELRLAAGQAWRSKLTSLLVVTLVALPLMFISGGLVFAMSHVPTLSQEVTAELGRSQARLQVVHGPDPSLSQAADEPDWWGVDADPETGVPINPELPALDDPLALLPAGTRVIELTHSTVRTSTPSGSASLSAVIGAAWDAALDGRYELIAGARPAGPDEAMVSPGALARLDAQIGDTLELTEPAASFTIAGVLSLATNAHSAQTVYIPAAPAVEGMRLWFTPDWQPTIDELSRFNREGVVVFARDLVLDRAGAGYVDPSTAWALGSAAAIIAGFTGYLVVLLAGAAFSVSARRQQHALAVAASVGAPSASLFRIVLLQGTVLGLVGGLVGAAAGIAAAYPALLLFDDGSASSFWGFHVPWWGIAGVIAFAVVVGTVAAIAPARAATRGDVLHALRGSRRPVRLRADRPLWGSALIVVGLGLTVVSGLTLASLTSADEIDYGNGLMTLTVWGIVAGPLLFQIGVILAGHWLLTLLGRASARLGLSARIAARDAAAHPGRIVPALGAIAACVFLASFALSALSIGMASSARNYWWQAPEGSLYIDLWTTAEAEGAVQAVVAEALLSADPDAVAVVRGEPRNFDVIDGVAADDRVATVWRPETFGAPSCDDPAVTGMCMREHDQLFGYQTVTVIAADELATALGTDIPPAAMRVFSDGGAIVLDGTPWSLVSVLNDDSVTLREWSGELFAQDMTAGFDEPLPDPLRTVTLPALHVDTPHSLPWTLILSPQTAAELGMGTAVHTMIGVFDEPPSQQALDRVAQVAAEQSVAAGGFSYNVENGPPDPAPWLWLILGAAGVLVLGAGGVALGLARVERRPDDATLTAVGAAPRLRRGIAFWQAIVIVGLGAVTGTAAGLIPMWGIAMAIEDLEVVDAPWPLLGLLAVGLPLAIAVVSWLVSPRHPDLTRRTAIA